MKVEQLSAHVLRVWAPPYQTVELARLAYQAIQESLPPGTGVIYCSSPEAKNE